MSFLQSVYKINDERSCLGKKPFMKLSFNLQRQQGMEFYSKQSDNLNANNLLTLKPGLLVTISLYFCLFLLLTDKPRKKKSLGLFITTLPSTASVFLKICSLQVGYNQFVHIEFNFLLSK